jgi:monothiol glutaredoxin
MTIPGPLAAPKEEDAAMTAPDSTRDDRLPAELRERIAALIAADDIVLFMKGTREAPRCGFSAAVVEILDELLPAGAGYRTVDVLADPAVREGVKAYSDWPTIPQLYIKGELIGGADIAREMAASGELQGKLGVEKADRGAPAELAVTITEEAAKVLREAQRGEPPENRFLRLVVSPRYQHQLGFSPEKAGDVKVASAGLEIVIDAGSARRAGGVRIDAIEQPGGGVAFRIENPNEPPAVKQMSAHELKQRLEQEGGSEGGAGAPPLALFDVRTPGERAIGTIAGSLLFDDDGRAALAALPRETTLVFFCHHGSRSQAAAEHALKLGFTRVYNLAGGIDAWSSHVDPSVARY